MLQEIINRLGEPWRNQFFEEFGLAKSDKVADFYNHGGFTLNHEDTGENLAVHFAEVYNGVVYIGVWQWYDWEDFDEDAEWMVLKEDDFTEQELTDIYRQIRKVYEHL